MEELCNGKELEFSFDQASMLRCGNHLCMLDVGDLRKTNLKEAHSLGYTIHPGFTKMY